MADAEVYESFLGTGWAFPVRFSSSGAVMSRDEQDIAESLKILLGTAPGERFLEPKFGIDLHGLQFESMSTTLRSLVLDQVRTALLIYEPRIRLLDLNIGDSDEVGGVLGIHVSYEIRSTNSRFNLVFPFYTTDSNEARGALRGG